MTLPRPEAASAGRHACTDRMLPFRLVPMTSSMSASVMSASLASGKTPALAHSTSMPPIRSAAVRGQLGHARLRGLLVAPGDQDPGTAPGEHRGDSLADAAGRAGDHHGPALDRCEHARYPFALPGGR